MSPFLWNNINLFTEEVNSHYKADQSYNKNLEIICGIFFIKEIGEENKNSHFTRIMENVSTGKHF